MFKFIFLGIVQGLTEFLPVSSSGHLAVLEKLLGIQTEVVAVAIVLHLGTILSLLVFFFKDILELLRKPRTVLLVIVVTIITGAIGIGGKDFFENLFSLTKPIAIAWLFTGIVLLAAKRFIGGKRNEITLKDALILGLTQGLAIIPGFSRSGITISTLLFRKIERQAAFKFSFLAAIPAIAGAAFLEARKIDFAVKLNPVGLSAGFICSFLSGLFALYLLRCCVKKAQLHYFGYYCIVIAVLTFVFVK